MGFFDRAKQAREQAAEAMGSMGGVKGMMGQVGQAMPGGGGGDMSEQLAYRDLAQKLSSAGVEAPATLNAMRPTGDKDFGGGEKYEMDITVTPTGGAPYNTTVKQSFLPAQIEGISVGGALTIKYDPDDQSKAMIYGW